MWLNDAAFETIKLSLDYYFWVTVVVAQGFSDYFLGAPFTPLKWKTRCNCQTALIAPVMFLCLNDVNTISFPTIFIQLISLCSPSLLSCRQSAEMDRKMDQSQPAVMPPPLPCTFMFVQRQNDLFCMYLFVTYVFLAVCVKAVAPSSSPSSWRLRSTNSWRTKWWLTSYGERMCFRRPAQRYTSTYQTECPLVLMTPGYIYSHFKTLNI